MTVPKGIRYAQGKLYSVVWELAVGEGVVTERLADAYRDFRSLSPNDFPESLRGDFEWIRKQFSDARKGQNLEAEADARKFLRGLIPLAGREIAERIVRLHDAVGDSLSDSTPDA